MTSRHLVVVVVVSELYGEAMAIVMDVAADRLIVDMPYRPPLGTALHVHFGHVGDPDRDEQIVAIVDTCAHVKISDDDALVVLRIVGFVDHDEGVPVDRLH